IVYGGNWPRGSTPWDGNGISHSGAVVEMANIRDGTSNTYMLGEKYIPPDDYYSGWDHGDDHGFFPQGLDSMVAVEYHVQQGGAAAGEAE
ncbi:MAG: DUF1559 domain-containing protein, partial [Woeseiaceae bacterium]|nr:DUF1559 domain-containing protein [Woeseiaceae bacterium]